MKALQVAILLTCLSPCVAVAQQVLFSDSFQTDLSAWATVGYGAIVDDALIPGNRALAFTHTADSGNMWSPAIVVDPLSTYIMTFKYRGQASGADSGGYLWLVDPASTNPLNYPVWGTQPGNVSVELIDDGAWHSYELTFHLDDFFNPIGGTIMIVVEDWNGAAGNNPPPNIAGDAMFDDIQLTKLDPVQSEASTWGALKSLFR